MYILENFTAADLAIVVIIIASAVFGYKKGFVRGGIALICWVLAFICGFKYGAALGELFFGFVKNETLRTSLGFSLIFIIMVLMGVLITYVCEHLVDKVNLYHTNKRLGFLFGIVRGGFYVAILMILGQLTPLPSQSWWVRSAFLPYFQPVASMIVSVLPPSLQDKIHHKRSSNQSNEPQRPPLPAAAESDAELKSIMTAPDDAQINSAPQEPEVSEAKDLTDVTSDLPS